MSLLTLKSVVWYCRRYTERFYVRAEDRWTMWSFMRQMSDDMFEHDTLLTYEQALDLAARVWAFAKWVAEKHELADDSGLERMCLSSMSRGGFFGDDEKGLVYEMGELASYLDGRGAMQVDHLNRLLSVMTSLVAGVIEREAPGFFHPERVLAKYCKDHLASHNDETRAKMGWSEFDEILYDGRWLSKDQALRFAIESWRVSQTALHANVDELEDIAIKPTLITDHYLSQNDSERLVDSAHHLLYNIRFGSNREESTRFLTRSMKICADSLILTYPEMFSNKKVGS